MNQMTELMYIIVIVLILKLVWSVWKTHRRYLRSKGTSRNPKCIKTVVKCDDQQCCSPRRSSLHVLLHDLFLLPPYPIQVNGHPVIPDPEQHDGKTFAPFLIRHCLPIQPLHTFTSIPYDIYCPSLRHDVEKRCCNTCGIYFASITKVVERRRARAVQTLKLRPSRIVTR
ncbi:uncharacterized protein LOC130450228 isoform X2 [Diorhabda sublineata]|uniref:uncharacterized protein LOC130450228 isoform X2 n=1 Tax=Diorhabda sublineata TaxID=1163346 RepID=UPI0024E18079|nr:uncharacterized protein LOC130450228 isoform X2 [Diorhabda sublineata]